MLGVLIGSLVEALLLAFYKLEAGVFADSHAAKP